MRDRPPYSIVVIGVLLYIGEICNIGSVGRPHVAEHPVNKCHNLSAGAWIFRAEFTCGFSGFVRVAGSDSGGNRPSYGVIVIGAFLVP